jgi:NADP-reducing hydrogenase subunit HndC
VNLPFRRHVLVCTGPRCGGERNSMRIRQELRREFVRQAVPRDVKDTQCICFGLCSYGPNVIVYPEGAVYSGVRPQDVAAIVRQHLLGGRVVEHLLLRNKAGADAAPAAGEDDPADTAPPDEPAPAT